jgi:hypothetical protein
VGDDAGIRSGQGVASVSLAKVETIWPR